ncbi:MAG: peptidase S41 [Cyclobacteriaceae bacterium]|nr:peptidase S41 [Cyclobacteriaceae bacterium]
MRQIYFLIYLLFSINAFGQTSNTLSSTEKVYGLSKFWQEVNYNFIYLSKVDRKKWDSTYVALIEKVQQTKDDYEYYRLLKRFCAMLKDGHTNIDFPSQVQSKLMKTTFGEYRIFVENIQHKAIVTQVNPSKEKVIPPGSEILEVNGQSTREYIKQFVAPYISSSTGHVLEDMATQDMLQGLEGESYLLKIKRPNGEIVELTVTHSRSSEIDLYPGLSKPTSLLEFKWMENKIAYVALNSFQDQAIDSMFEAHLPELYKAEGLIIDLRRNGGGNGQYGLDILKHLIPGKKVLGAKSQTRNHIATYKAWGEMVNPQDTASNAEYKKAYLNYIDKYYFDFPNSSKSTKTHHKKIIVPTIVVVGHHTASAAEDFLIYANGQRHFTTLGAPTFGSTGQPFYFMLPGGAQARVCTKRDTYPNGKEFVGVGIIPDLIVERTISDFLNGIDPELEKAAQVLRGKIK